MKSARVILQKIKELIASNQFILYLVILVMAFFIFLIIQAHPSFMDPDSFYHLKMSKLIAAQGPIMNFPWLQFTVLKNYYIDQHFLYHVLAIPFIKLLGDFPGYKFYTVFLNTLLIMFFYWFLKKEKIRYAEIFILLLLASQGFLFRVSLAKASSFSLLFLFVGIYFLAKRKIWPLFFLSWLYVWAYGGFFLIWVMTGFYILADSLYQAYLAPHPLIIRFWRKPWVFIKNIFSWANFKLGLAAIGGVICGLVLNPYFPKNLSFIWQQLVQIGLINYLGKVNVGGEWYPYKWQDLVMNGGVAFIVFILFLAIFIITIKKQKPASIFFLITTFFFLVFTMKSKRYVEYLMPHLVFFTAFAATYALAEVSLLEKIIELKKLHKIIAILLYIIILASIIFFPLVMARDIKQVYSDYRGGIALKKYSGVGAYLAEHSKSGEIVMQTDWSDFPMLFYQDSKNYYVVGLDPTFMYNLDPKLYQLFADITMAKISTGLANLVKDNFHASYFVVDTGRDQLNKYLQADEGFVKVYEDGDCWLYKVK